jgi:DNA-directed RNA polymerase specialized sigma24 family protein
MSQAEIAEAMGRSEGAVRNLIYRGLARLTVMMDKGDG